MAQKNMFPDFFVESMGQDSFQLKIVPRKFKGDCWKWQSQSNAAGAISPEEQKIFIIDNTAVGDENVPFLLRILRTGSKSDIYFGNKDWIENSAECLCPYRAKIILVKLCFSIPFS